MFMQAIKHFYGYHFAENRKLWALIISLTNEQFTQNFNYSHVSVKNQLIHLISVDDAWFSDLSGEMPGTDPANLANRDQIRVYWDAVERKMQNYIDSLQDADLTGRPLEGEDKDLYLWQVLLHVVNHGTDHRAQILRMLHDLNVATPSQDYIFYTYEIPWQNL